MPIFSPYASGYWATIAPSTRPAQTNYYGTATKHQVGWNKRSGSTDPPSVALYGGSTALDPPYGTATKHQVGWNKQGGSTKPPERCVIWWVRYA